MQDTQRSPGMQDTQRSPGMQDTQRSPGMQDTQRSLRMQTTKFQLQEFESTNCDDTNETAVNPCPFQASAPWQHGSEIESTLQSKSDPNGENFSQSKPCVQMSFLKKPGTAHIKGQLYKIQLSMLFLLEGLQKKLERKIVGFHLASNVEEAGDFRDVVFRYRYVDRSKRDETEREMSRIIFLSSKHVDHPKNRKISVDAFSSRTGKKDNLEISLEKLFSSYREIKHRFSQNPELNPIFGNSFQDLNHEFIIFTNALSTFDEREEIQKIPVDKKDFLYLNEKPENNNYLSVTYDAFNDKAEVGEKPEHKPSAKVISSLKYSSHSGRLAKDLVSSFFPHRDNQNAEITHQGILKEYHIPLAKVVIKKTNRKSGILNTDFLDGNLCEQDRVFRNAFFEEAKKITKMSEDKLRQNLRNITVKVSDKFGGNTVVAGGSFTSLPRDHISEVEIQEFFSKLKFFIGQPSENELPKIIKDKMELIFSVEKDDIDSIFYEVRTKVERWWKEENYCLTEKNRFFQDSIRISIFCDVKKPVQSFTGRKKELNALHSMMQEKAVSQKVAITGLGGIGKTELVRQYVYKYSQYYDNNVVWVNAQNYGTMVESFHSIAHNKLKINIKNARGKQKDVKCTVEDVYKYFCKRKSLFVFDNAEAYKSHEENDSSIDKFLPQSLPNSKCYVLITSRNQEWENLKTLSLDVLTEEDAAEFIRTTLNIQLNSQECQVKQLTKALQCLPLALQQAVAYIREENKEMSGEEFSIDSYLDEYKKEGTKLKRLLDFDLSGNNDYGRTTYITWQITLQKIKTIDYGEEALGIFNIMAYFAPDRIETEPFLKVIPDKRELAVALRLLERYSLVRLEKGEARVHRLVQQVIRTDLKERHKEKEVLGDALNLVQNVMETGEGVSFESTFHAMSAWTYASKYEELVKNFSNLPSFIVHCLDSCRRFVDAYKFGQQVCVLLGTSLGPKHRNTLLTRYATGQSLSRCGKYQEALSAYESVLNGFVPSVDDNSFIVSVKNSMAFILEIQNKFDEALNVYKEVLESKKKHLGDDHPDILNTMVCIANVMDHLGKRDEALGICYEVLNKRMQTLGPDHRDTLNIKQTIAKLLRNKGKCVEAFRMLQEILDTRNQVMGPNHPDTSQTKDDIILILCDERKFEEAMVSCQELVSEEEQISGPDQPSTFLPKLRRAQILFEQGEYDQALGICQDLLDKNQQHVGCDHPDILQTLIIKASILHRQGKYDESFVVYTNLLNNTIQNFGPNHSVTLKIEHCLALILSKQGKYEEALLAYRDVLRKAEEILGSDHPDTLAMQDFLAISLTKKGNLKEALETYENVLNKRQILNPNDPDILVTKENMISIVSKFLDYDAALQFYREVLDKKKQDFGPQHPASLQTRFCVAALMYEHGRYDDALLEFQELLEISKQVLGYNHPDTLKTMNRIAIVLRSKNFHHMALKIHLEVLNEQEETLGSDHPETLMTKENILSLLNHQKYYAKALNYGREVLDKKKSIFGSDHVDTLSTQSGVVQSLAGLGQYGEAFSACKEILDQCEEKLGNNDPLTLVAQSNLAIVLGKQGYYTKALGIFEDVLEKRRQILGKDHPDTLKTQDKIAAVLNDLGFYDSALQARQEVLKSREQVLGPDHPDSLKTKCNIAEILLNQNLYEGALKLYRDVFNKRKALLGPDNYSTLLTQAKIATILHCQRNYEEALQIYHEVLEKRKGILRHDHPDTLATLNDMARVLSDQKHFDVSLKLHENVLVKREQVMGPAHPDTLRTKSDIAGIHLKTGNCEMSLKMYNEVLTSKKKTLGVYHPSLLATQMMIIQVLESQGNYIKALEMCEEVLRNSRLLMSSDHPDTLYIKETIAKILHSMDKFDDALNIYQEVLNKRKQILGPNHPHVLATQTDIAQVFYSQENYEAVLGVLREVLEKSKQLLGSEHPNSLLIMDNIAALLYSTGKFDEALETDRESLNIRKHFQGPDHPDILSIENRIATIEEIGLIEILRQTNKEQILKLYHSDPLRIGNTVLHAFAAQGDLDVVKHLLGNGADVVSRNEHDTLLHQATHSGNCEVIELILNKMKEKEKDLVAHIDAADLEGDTPLMWAAQTGNLGAAQLLLEYGANGNAKNKDDQTALHWAAKGGHLQIIELLLRREVDPKVKDKNGYTALDLARENLAHDKENQESLKNVIALLVSVAQEPLTP